MREMSVKNIVRMWDTYLVRLLFVSTPPIADLCTIELGRGFGRLLRVSSLRLPRLPRQVERPIARDGFPVDYHVPTVIADAELGRQEHRAAAQ